MHKTESSFEFLYDLINLQSLKTICRADNSVRVNIRDFFPNNILSLAIINHSELEAFSARFSCFRFKTELNFQSDSICV